MKVEPSLSPSTMSLAPVDTKGTHLLYHDSGIPGSSASYVTLVVFHGTVFHSENFKPMLLYACTYNMRIVLVNLRGYPGSTPFSSEEVDVMLSQDIEGMTTILEERGREAASFLSWLIETKGLPPILTSNGVSEKHQKRLSGGIAVLGWSSGAAIPFSLLSNAGKLPKATQELLERYLRSCILWDPASYAVGCQFPPIEEFYCPLRDPALTPEEIAQTFVHWVSSFFEHDPYTLDSLESATSFSTLIPGISGQPISDPPEHQLPVTKTLSPKQFVTNVDLRGALGSHVPYLFMNRAVYEENARRALQGKSIWPNVKMVLVWCDMSVGEVLLGSWRIIQLAQESKNGRGLVVQRMRGANHFPHWNEAERTVKLLAELL
ncbi:hypothetical protein CERSUDRAFT_119070 [Gelatoporia subvermispora B]|uniref:Uncharacterized protein n=1 Tax=Ceriporiopsis subvermispora (strain B) TaxID=914234 RepID=M2Q5J8_CERS8|nr:hypothetical protein CERSUDRAFT_119070 [Gelatoporia subvermispora B]